MKTYILAALLGTLTQDQVQSLQVNQRSFTDTNQYLNIQKQKPEGVEEAEAKRWRETETENDIVVKKFKNYTKDVEAGMKRDNVWTNGTKSRISSKSSSEKDTPEYSSSEEWTRNMPSHIPDDIQGPTTSRTAAPAMDGSEKEYKFDNVTKSGPSASEIAEAYEPKKTSASKNQIEKISKAAGVDIDSGLQADKKAQETAKAEAALVKAEAAKAKAEADAQAKLKAKAAEEAAEASAKAEETKAGEEGNSGGATAGGKSANSAGGKSGKSSGGKSGKSASTDAPIAIDAPAASDKSSAEIIHDQDEAEAAKEGPAPKAPVVPEPVKGTHGDKTVEFTPNKTTGSGVNAISPGLPTEIGGISARKSAPISAMPPGFPTELGFVQQAFEHKFSSSDKTVPKDIATRAIKNLLQDPKKIVVQ